MAKVMKQAGGVARISPDPVAVERAFRKKLASSGVLLGAIVAQFIRPPLAKLYAYAGFDFVYLETEHVTFNGPELADFVLCCRDNGLPVIAKTPQLERAEIARLLDSGVMGIQLPRTESRADLLELISYVKYPPLGSRAGAPGYCNTYYVWPNDPSGWLKACNETTVIVGHIETAKGYKNAEQIITTPGLDMLYVGPYDLSISLGSPGNYDHPVVAKAIREIMELCIRHHVPFGTSTSGPAVAQELIKNGARFFETVDEITLICEGAVRTVDDYRAACNAALAAV
jgi:4-hydroxy-2-oxoheptanedioate aldolase